MAVSPKNKKPLLKLSVLNDAVVPLFQKKYLSFVYDISIYNQEAGDVSVKVLEINKYMISKTAKGTTTICVRNKIAVTKENKTYI